MTWMHMAVWMSSVATGVLAFTADGNGRYICTIVFHFMLFIGDWYIDEAERIGLLLLPVALLFVIYAVRQYLTRSEKIKGRDSDRYQLFQ